jgi:hypothetical protein
MARRNHFRQGHPPIAAGPTLPTTLNTTPATTTRPPPPLRHDNRTSTSRRKGHLLNHRRQTPPGTQTHSTSHPSRISAHQDINITPADEGTMSTTASNTIHRLAAEAGPTPDPIPHSLHDTSHDSTTAPQEMNTNYDITKVSSVTCVTKHNTPLRI